MLFQPDLSICETVDLHTSLKNLSSTKIISSLRGLPACCYLLYLLTSFYLLLVFSIPFPLLTITRHPLLTIKSFQPVLLPCASHLINSKHTEQTPAWPLTALGYGCLLQMDLTITDGFHGFDAKKRMRPLQTTNIPLIHWPFRRLLCFRLEGYLSLTQTNHFQTTHPQYLAPVKILIRTCCSTLC